MRLEKGDNKPTRQPAGIGSFLRQTTAGRILVFVSLPLALLLIALWEPTHEPPIFDAQVHYNQDSWAKVSPEAILNTAREVNIPWLLVGSTPNEGTWKLQNTENPHVIPMLVPYRTREDSETWFEDKNIQKYIEEEIARGIYFGIGEFHLFNGQVDTPVVHRMVELATTNHLVLHARSDPIAIEQLFALDTRLKILWAHAGMFTPPETVGKLLDQYPNLWVEISHRGDVAPKGTLDPKWRELMLRHSTRFLLGSGTYRNEYWYQFRYMHARYRDWLKKLPPDPMERIAYRNGLALFGLY